MSSGLQHTSSVQHNLQAVYDCHLLVPVVLFGQQRCQALLQKCRDKFELGSASKACPCCRVSEVPAEVSGFAEMCRDGV